MNSKTTTTRALSQHSNVSEAEPFLGLDHQPHKNHHVHPKTVSRIVVRITALTNELLPIQVDLGE